MIKRIADLVFTVTGKNPLLEIALELERIALQDDYFVTRKLYPNVDFYSGLIYQAMGFPVEMFPVLFAIPRTAGWIAQWEEMLLDPEQKIARPRQIYTGPGRSATTSRGKSAHDRAVARAARRARAAGGRAGAEVRLGARRGSTCGRWSRSARGPSGSPAIEQTRASTSRSSSPPPG